MPWSRKNVVSDLESTLIVRPFIRGSPLFCRNPRFGPHTHASYASPRPRHNEFVGRPQRDQRSSDSEPKISLADEATHRQATAIEEKMGAGGARSRGKDSEVPQG